LARPLLPGAPRLLRDLRLCPRVCPDDRYAIFVGFILAEKTSLDGRRIGVIGTGSSRVQAIPVLAKHAEHLYVFQRTANYVVPARTAPIGAAM
jgi:hypothetical protein